MTDIITPFAIAPHPVRGTTDASSERIVLLNAEIRAASGSSDERPIIEITSSSTGEDRHGSRIFEWFDDSYMRTGHVLWQHDMVPAYPFVGKKLSRKQVGDKSVSEIELLVNLWRHMNVNLAAFLWEAFRDHGMGAMSRGFIPLEMKRREATTIPVHLAENIDYLKVEQTEESFVNVPSNRDSFARAIERKRTAGTFNDQLARMLGYDVTPYIITTAKESAMPTRTIQTFRADLTSTLQRCCGCEPYREPKPVSITEEQKAKELALMEELSRSLLTLLEIGIRGWKATVQSTERNFYSNVVIDSMYRIEGMIWRAKEWYDADLSVEIPSADAATAAAEIAAAAPAETVTRAIRKARRASRTPEQRAAFRAKAAELVRCCGCYPCEEEKPTLPTDDATRALEIAMLRDLAEQMMSQVEMGMRIWTSAETDRLRSMGQDLVSGGMWFFDYAARSLDGWYGEDLEAVPDVDVAEIERALDGHQHIRAGAVFSKKNLEKIDQVITIMGELRAAATKPTADDIPDEQRQYLARLAQFKARMAGPFDYASTQVTLAGEVAEQVLALGSTLIPDEALADKGRETDPHVTVKFGIDPAVAAVELAEVIENSDTAKEIAARGATMTLGATAVFEADEYDVVYVAVESADLVKFNEIISAGVKVTDTHPDYVPHVTLAYVTKGEGQKYAGDETLNGTVVPFDTIVYSDVDGETSNIPLAGEGLAAFRGAGTIKIRIKDTGNVAREQVTTSPLIRVLASDTARGRAAGGPSTERPLYVRLLND